MRLIRGLHNLKAIHRGCALTIGNFDGLHLGHQALLRLLSQEADKKNISRCMMTFEPLPHEFFSGDHGVSRLMNTREKLMTLSNTLEEVSPDFMLLMNFNKYLAEMTAEAFIEKILIEALAIKSLVIGDDFRFGKNRSGDLAMLRAFGSQYNFDVISLSTHQIDNIRVSSSRIREAMANDQLEDVQNMLGRTYQICGRVAHGDKRGRTIGFPTANIHLHRTVTPLHGVYSVTMQSDTLSNVPGIANIGRRPTVNGERIQLEVHVFNFDQDIYGQNVCVNFHQKIREERKFESFDSLRKQIINDCQQAREFHGLAN